LALLWRATLGRIFWKGTPPNWLREVVGDRAGDLPYGVREEVDLDVDVGGVAAVARTFLVGSAAGACIGSGFRGGAPDEHGDVAAARTVSVLHDWLPLLKPAKHVVLLEQMARKKDQRTVSLPKAELE